MTATATQPQATSAAAGTITCATVRSCWGRRTPALREPATRPGALTAERASIVPVDEPLVKSKGMPPRSPSRKRQETSDKCHWRILQQLNLTRFPADSRVLVQGRAVTGLAPVAVGHIPLIHLSYNTGNAGVIWSAHLVCFPAFSRPGARDM